MPDLKLSDWVELLTALGSVVAAGALVVTAFIARNAANIARDAAKEWRSTLEQQRKDECVSAAHKCAAAIGRAVTLKTQNNKDLPTYYRDAWDKWSEVRWTYAVVRRYSPTKLPRELIDPGLEVMEDLREFIYPKPEGTKPTGANINTKFGRFVSGIEDAFGLPPGSSQ